jgi:hypothetical protein
MNLGLGRFYGGYGRPKHMTYWEWLIVLSGFDSDKMGLVLQWQSNG